MGFKKINKNSKAVLKLFVVMTLFGCVKNRPEQFADGSGLASGDIVKKETLLDVTETVIAKEKNQDATDREYKLTIEDSAKDMFDDLGYVDYETDSWLLKNSPRFIGKPGAKYNLKRVLEGDRLIVYKVSDSKNISYIEKTNLVKEFDNGQIGVPYLSFPVSYFKVRKIRDLDLRDTRQKTEERINDPKNYKSAPYVSVNWDDRTVFTESGVDKSSFFPKSFFKNNEWYYSAFKTDTSDFESGGNHFIFIQTAESRQAGIFRNVKFEEFDKNTFAAVSSALPEEVKNNPLSQATVAPLKVKWVKLRVNSSLNGVQKEESDDSGNFKDSEYLQIDFLDSFKEMSKNFVFRGGDQDQATANKVVEVIIAKDLFSFIVENDTAKYRINFLRKNNSADYKELATFHEDNTNKFGIFYMVKPTYNLKKSVQTEDDFYKHFRTQRFNPNRKNIVYHISEESPKNQVVQESADLAVQYINDAFKYIYKDKPSEAIKVSLSEKRVRRGDPRYNILDYNSENNSSTYGGLGNPYIDENTGEIISATTFVYYGITKFLYENALTEYLGSLTGLYQTGQMLARPVGSGSQNSLLDYSSKDVSLVYMPSEYAENLQSLLNLNTTQSAFNFLPFGTQNAIVQPCFSGACDTNLNALSGEQLVKAKLQVKPKNMFDFYVQNASNSYSRINYESSDSHNVFRVNRRSGAKSFLKLCDLNKIESLYRSFNGSSEYLKSKSVEACIEKVMVKPLVATVVHEILHNFGLGHNMHGSTDSDNYLTPELIKQVYNEDVDKNNMPFMSNSIMDYFEYRTDDAEYPSTYDWAVLRYLYRNQIEMSDGRMVSLVKGPQDKLLDSNVVELEGIDRLERKLGESARTFDYCLQAEIAWGTNPMCDTFDIGDTPMTIVQNYIEEYQYIVEHNTKRAGRNNFEPESVSNFKKHLMKKVTTFYTHWRKELVTVVGDENRYLENYLTSQEFYEDFVSKLQFLSEEDQQRVLEYYQVRNVIYSFLRDQVFKAPLTCIYEQQFGQEGKDFGFIDFDQVYKNLLASSSRYSLQEIEGCETAAVQEMSKKLLFDRLKAINPRLEPGDVQMKYLAQEGLPLRDYSYSLNSAKYKPGDIDISGFASSKYMAAFYLLGRQFAPVITADEIYVPTFLDEPEFRDNFEFLLKNRYLNGFWVSSGGSDLLNLQVDPSVVNALAEPEHAAFRDLMNTYGPDGAKEYASRRKKEAYIEALNNNNQDLFSLMSLSPYFHNIAINTMMEDDKIQDKASILPRLYGKRFVPSYLSESNIISMYSNYFRAGLTVPNNLSVTKERTKRFQMGISSNDASYLAFIRDRYDNVADLGPFVVYPKNDQSTFAKDLIIEVDGLNSATAGVVAEDVDLEKSIVFLKSMFDEYFLDLNNKVFVDKKKEKFHSLTDYMRIQSDFLDLSQDRLARVSDDEMNVSTKIATRQLVIGVARAYSESLASNINNLPLEAYDRFGNNLNYGDAVREILNLQASLKGMEAQGIDLPSMKLNKEKLEENQKNLIKVVTEFESNNDFGQLKSAGNVLGENQGRADDYVFYRPIVNVNRLVAIVDYNIDQAMEKNMLYRYDIKEFDEKKELLNKFLYILAISR